MVRMRLLTLSLALPSAALLVAGTTTPAAAQMNQYEMQHGQTIEVSVDNLLQMPESYTGKAVRTRGQLEMTPNLNRVAYALRGTFGGYLYLFPVAQANLWDHMRGVYGVGWGWIIMAEIVVRPEYGLGGLIEVSTRRSQTSSVYAIILVIVLIAVACDQLWATCGKGRSRAAARIAAEGRATHLGVLKRWDMSSLFTYRLQLEGSTVTRLYSGEAYRVYRLDPPTERSRLP